SSSPSSSPASLRAEKAGKLRFPPRPCRDRTTTVPMTSPAPVSSGAPAEWSIKAIAGAVFGLLGLATLWLGFGLLFAAAAAVLGHVARHETSARLLRGRGFATFGLWLGYGAMLLFPAIVLLAA